MKFVLVLNKEATDFSMASFLISIGWGGRIRTSACQYQKLVPYRLATPQKMGLIFNKYIIDFLYVQPVQRVLVALFLSYYTPLRFFLQP